MLQLGSYYLLGRVNTSGTLHDTTNLKLEVSSFFVFFSFRNRFSELRGIDRILMGKYLQFRKPYLVFLMIAPREQFHSLIHIDRSVTFMSFFISALIRRPLLCHSFDSGLDPCLFLIYVNHPGLFHLLCIHPKTLVAIVKLIMAPLQQFLDLSRHRLLSLRA